MKPTNGKFDIADTAAGTVNSNQLARMLQLISNKIAIEYDPDHEPWDDELLTEVQRDEKIVETYNNFIDYPQFKHERGHVLGKKGIYEIIGAGKGIYMTGKQVYDRLSKLDKIRNKRKKVIPRNF